MPTYSVRIYDLDPFGVFGQTAGDFANWSGSSDPDGWARITDNEAGVEGLTLDDDSNGGETATATVEIGGNTSVDSDVDAEEVWTLRDTVTGEIFQLITFQVEDGPAAAYYTLSEIPLVAGRSYETLEFNSNPDVTAGDIAFNSDDYDDVAFGDHIVTGTAGADTIDDTYTGDAEGDQVDDGVAGGTNGNDNDIEGLAGNDTIDGGAGDDTIDGGADDDVIDGGSGDDSVVGGTGTDTIDGGAGDDTIDGGDEADEIEGGAGGDSIDGGDGNDTIFGDDNGGTGSVTEFVNWSAEGGDGTSVAGGLTQNTGEMDVTVSFTNDGNNNPTYQVETSETVYVDTGEPFDANSNLRLFGDGDAATSTTTFDFAAASGSTMQDEVENVSFRLNDIDFSGGNHEDIITVNAFDANGDPVTVTFTAAGDETVLGNTITAGGALDDPDDANGSVLIEIAGPVSQIEIIYSNGLGGTQAVHVSEIYFETIPDPLLTGADEIDGGAGDDVIDGEVGNDTITGGTGNDTMTGGAGDDFFVLSDGSGNDVITDFDTDDDDGDGFFNDQLNVTGMTDGAGNPVNAWDVVISDDGFGNALLTFPNGETIVLQGVTPAEVTGAQLLNAAGVPCFTPGTRIRTPGGLVPIELLRPGDLVSTLDTGPQPIRWIGRRDLSQIDLLINPKLKPVLIPCGVLDNSADLLVSPQHGLLIGDYLVRAKHLAEAPGPIRIAKGKRAVTYIHLLLDRHQILLAENTLTESFYPGPQSIRMLDDASGADLLACLPGLTPLNALDAYGPTARPYLKRKDVEAYLRRLNALLPSYARLQGAA